MVSQSHLVAKRATKESAEREMKRAKKAVPMAEYTIRKYGDGYAIFTIDKKVR